MIGDLFSLSWTLSLSSLLCIIRAPFLKHGTNQIYIRLTNYTKTDFLVKISETSEDCKVAISCSLYHQGHQVVWLSRTPTRDWWEEETWSALPGGSEGGDMQSIRAIIHRNHRNLNSTSLHIYFWFGCFYWFVSWGEISCYGCESTNQLKRLLKLLENLPQD